MATCLLSRDQTAHSLVQYIRSSEVQHYLACYVKVFTFDDRFPLTNRLHRLRESHFGLVSLGYAAFVLHQNSIADAPREVMTSCMVFEDYHQFLCGIVSNKNALEDLRKYIRTSFLVFLDLMIEFTPEAADLDETDVELQGVKEMLRSVANWIPATAVKAINWTVEKIIESFKEHFQQVVEKACPIAMQACSWINSIWDKITEWIKDAAEAMAWYLQGTKELITWGICMLATSCAIGVVEKALVMLGFLSGGLDLVKTFLTSAAMTGAFMSLKGVKTEMQMTYFHMVTIMAGVVATTITAAFGAPTCVVLQAGPVEMLEIAAQQLGSFCDTTLLSFGKTCQAVNQITACATNLSALAGRIFSCLQNFVWQMFGMESRFLRDAALVFEEDIDQWFKDIARAQDTFLARAYATQDDMMTMQGLVQKGHLMRKKILTSAVRVSPVLSNTIVKAVDTIEKLLRDATFQGVRADRKMPFVVYAYGTSRVGKTLVTNKLISDFKTHFGLPAETVYSRNPIDPYWSGYRRQPIVLIDDFGAVACDPSMEAQLIPLVSSAPYPLTMASLEEKGLLFDSKFIFCSSNRLEASPESKVHDDDAFRNRRHVVIDVSLNPHKKYNPENFTENQVYRILTHVGERYDVSATFESYDDLLAYCLTRWEKHEKEQTQNLAATLNEPELEGDFGKFEHLLTMATTFATPLDELQKRMDMQKEEEGQFVHFVSFRRKGELWHYAINGNQRVMEWKQKFTAEEETELEKKSETLLFQAYKFLRYSQDTNLVIKTHLGVLAKEDSYDEKMNFIGLVENPNYHAQIKPSIDAMSAWQRLILCGMGAVMERTKKTTWYSQMTEKLKDCVYTMYSKEIADWPTGLKIVVGVVLASVLGTGFWKLFDVLRNAGTGGAFAGAAAMEFGAASAIVQSRKASRFVEHQHKYRNVPITRRAWAQGTMPLEHASATIMSRVKASMRYGATEVQIVMLPGRRFLGYAHYFRKLETRITVRIYTGSREYIHSYDPKCMEYFDDNELCLYKNPALEDIPSTSWDLFCWDYEEKLPTTFSAQILSCKPAYGTGLPDPTWAPIDVRVRHKTLELKDGDYVRKIPMYLEYEAPTVNHDCGSLIVAKIGNSYQVVGVHVAGAGGKLGFASLLPQVPMVAQAQHSQEFFDFYPQEHEVSDGKACVGELKKGVWIPLPTKTSLHETPPQWHLDTPCDKYPSILSRTDPRLLGTGNEDYDPFQGGIAKYAQPMGVLEQELLEETANEIVESWFDCCDETDTFEEVSTQEALNGIEGVSYMERVPLSTSEGFPHILSRKNGEKGKGRFVEGDGVDMRLIPDTTVTRAMEDLEKLLPYGVPTLVGIECPKDEKLPYRKIFEKPKTRCFTILPMEYNLVVRKKFLNFVRFIMRRRDKLPCQVGINPYSMEWSSLAARLKGKGNSVLCCDYSSFDGLLSKQVMKVMADMINNLCGGTPKLRAEREHLLMACCSRLAICKESVWRVECGIPSGFPLTVICNSIFNELLVRYSYKAILRQQSVPKMLSVSFETYVSLVTYGDDNLISVHPVVVPFFDGNKLKNFLAKYSITITDGKDKTLPTLEYHPLEECDFLKRGFKQRTNTIWDAPEEKTSLWAQLHYVNTNNLDEQEAYKVNVVSVLTELYMHDPKESAEMRRKALSNVSWLTKADLPTMAQIEQFYTAQREQKMPDSNDALGLLLDLEALGPILAPQGVQRGVTLTEEVRTTNLGHESFDKAHPDEVWFLLNTMYPQVRLPPNVHSVVWTSGTGRGGLPTQTWTDSNIRRKNSNIRKIANQAFKEGKKVVVASRDAILPCNVFALLLLVYNGKLSRENSNGILTQIIAEVKTLGFLPREIPEVF
uniref:RNA1 polyprotein n=1 Tax=White-flower bittercress comovirus TaxID=3115808 RepID=A0AAT9JH16_9SECO